MFVPVVIPLRDYHKNWFVWVPKDERGEKVPWEFRTKSKQACLWSQL
jgi:hypothetical protein